MNQIRPAYLNMHHAGTGLSRYGNTLALFLVGCSRIGLFRYGNTEAMFGPHLFRWRGEHFY